jgi:hypothetical protein
MVPPFSLDTRTRLRHTRRAYLILFCSIDLILVLRLDLGAIVAGRPQPPS